MTKYELKYMFDWGSGTCIWSTNEEAMAVYDYPVMIDKLPISLELQCLLDSLIEEHDEAFNWDDPTGNFMWDDQRQKEFIESATEAYKRLCEELSPEYSVALVENGLI